MSTVDRVLVKWAIRPVLMVGKVVPPTTSVAAGGVAGTGVAPACGRSMVSEVAVSATASSGMVVRVLICRGVPGIEVLLVGGVGVR